MSAILENNKLVIKNHPEFYKEIINSVYGSVTIVKVDENGNTFPVWMNEHYSRITGYSFEDRQKMGFKYGKDELYHPDDLEIIRVGAKKLIKDREKGHTAMFRIKTKENDWKWVLSSCNAITLNGDSGYILCFMVDLSSRMNNYHFLTEKYTKEIKRLQNQITINKLTKTEKEITKDIASGKSSKQISEERERSYETINNHKRNIFSKLGICKTSELIGFAMENGLN